MRVLITGSNGQLGQALQATLPGHIHGRFLDHATLDITDPTAVRHIVREIAPDWIINAAAYTAVDRAESESEIAFAVNATAPRLLAEAAHVQGARLIQVSTDFIFDGTHHRPYRLDQAPHPINIYGQSKQEGEMHVLEILGEQALILRTAWVYAAQGHNFMHTILRLLAERDEVCVVDDQIGTPTHAEGLARAVWGLIERDVRGIHHWTDAGVASWYDFACAIRNEAETLNLSMQPATIRPIPSEQFPQAAYRPPFGVLDKTATWALLGQPAAHWRKGLHKVMGQIASSPLSPVD